MRSTSRSTIAFYLSTRIWHEVGLEKGKRQVPQSRDSSRRYPSFAFAWGKVDTVTKAKYLCVAITTTEVLEESSIKGMQSDVTILRKCSSNEGAGLTTTSSTSNFRS